MRRLIAAAAAALSVVVTSPPALAQTGAGSIRLVSQTSWVAPGGDFVMRLAATTKDAADLEVAVTVYPAVGSRSAFNETLSDRVTGSPISVKADALSDLPTDADGAVTITLPIQDPAQARDPLRVRLRGPGVYPVVVELRGVGGGRRVSRFVSHLVNVPTAVNGPRLATGLILPLAAPPALQADGTRRMSASWSTALQSFVASIEAYHDVPVTLLPQPETLQALSVSPRSEDRDAVAAFSNAAAGRLILGAPYVRLNEPAYAGDVASEEAAQRRHGLDVVGPLITTPPDATIAVVDDGLDSGTANRLADAQAERVVVREGALAPLGLRTTLTQTFQLRGRNGRRLPAVAADDGLAAHFTRKAPPALAAHQLLADLAVLYFDSPGLVRGVAALPPPAWRPSSEFLGAVLDGLRSSPILLPVDAAGLFAAVPAASGSRRGTVLQRDAGTASVAELPAADLRRARRDLAALDGLTIGANPDVTALHERVLTSQSADLRARQRTTYARAAATAIRDQLGAIRVPPNQSITLTARKGEIPVTILRGVEYPVRVVVEVSSDRLQFPEGASARLDLTRRNTTVRFTVQARTSGTFPLEVTLRSPDGDVVLSRGRFTIRSRAASGVGVILSVSAVVFLVLWWTRHIVQARRSRHAPAVAV